MNGIFQKGFRGVFFSIPMKGCSARVRTLEPSDIDSIIEFWRDLEPERMRQERGVLIESLPEKSAMRRDLDTQVGRGFVPHMEQHFVFEFDGAGIGSLYLERVEDVAHERTGWFHLHLWRPEFRRRGWMSSVLPYTLKEVYRVLDLDVGVGITAATNLGINRLLEGLGVSREGPIDYRAHETQIKQPSFIYRLTRDELLKWRA